MDICCGKNKYAVIGNSGSDVLNGIIKHFCCDTVMTFNVEQEKYMIFMVHKILH